MAAPSIHIGYNDSEIKIFWDFDKTGVYAWYNLYWSVDSGMAGEALVASNINNTSDGYYSSNSITLKFKREAIGLTNDSVFYMRLKGVSASGVEDAANPGAIRYISSLSEQLDQNKAVEIHGFDYTNKIWRKIKVDTTGTLS
jgi:hypothetical protein